MSLVNKKPSADIDNIQHEDYFEAQKIVDNSNFLIQQISYTAAGLPEYVGLAKPGTATSEAKWMIKKMTYSGMNVTAVEFADGDTKFDNVWDNRAGLSYS